MDKREGIQSTYMPEWYFWRVGRRGAVGITAVGSSGILAACSQDKKSAVIKIPEEKKWACYLLFLD